MENRFYIARTEDAADLPLPAYMSEGAAGMDLYANVKEEVTVEKGSIKLIPTGIRIALPEGFEAQIRPRSGLALKNGISLVNSPGTIDSDYRGEIGVIVINRYEKVEWTECADLDETERGEGGFGHSGV